MPAGDLRTVWYVLVEFMGTWAAFGLRAALAALASGEMG